jgi:ATP/ADP translocase
MLIRLSKLLNIRVEDLPLVLTLGFVLLGNSLAIQISYVASVSGFLSEVGANQFLLVLIASSVLILITISLQSLIIDRFNRIRLIKRISIGLALIFVLLRLMFLVGLPDPLNYSIFYLIAEQQWLLFPIIFWVLANDLFEVAQAKKIFPLISSFGFVGRLLGIGIATAFPLLFSKMGIQAEALSVPLITFNAILYLSIYWVLKVGLAKTKVRQMTHKTAGFRETLSEGIEFVQSVSSFRYLTFSLLAIAICDIIIEFHFLAVFAKTFSNPEQYQSFYGLYRLSLTLLAFFIQTFLTSQLLNNVGLKNTFLIMPIAVSLSLIYLILLPTSVMSGLIAILLFRLSWDTIDESARKSFQGLVPEERRGRVSLFMDGYLLAIGGIVGGLITAVIVQVGVRLDIATYHYFYLGFGAVVAACSIWAIWRMHRVYDKSLLNWRLKRRQRSKSVLDRLDI